MSEPSNSEPPAEALRNLELDEVTGERVSKTERDLKLIQGDILVKKRKKQREIAEKKAQKAANAPPSATSSKRKQDEGEDESKLDPRQYFEIRSRGIKRLKQTREPDPYPHKFHVTTNMNKFMGEYSSLKTGEERKDVEVRVGARIYGKRASGQHLMFYVVRVQGIRIQVMCQSNNANSLEEFHAQHEPLRRGDIIGIVGFPGRTNPRNRAEGELSIFAREVVLLSPCLHNMPDEYYGFKDQEERHRKRHLDLIMNDSVRQAFMVRGRMIDYCRTFFKERDFLEVETPMINQIAGGATAKPFKTFYNAHDQDVFMRIAPELFLKELVVGGLERVFEIGKNFRNEDADLTHNPEFTSCEFYMAFADMYDIMDMTEDLVSGMVFHALGKYETTYHTQSGEELHVNWAKPWRRVDLIPELEKQTGEKFPPGDQLHTQETNDFLQRVLKKTNVQCPPPLTNARMIDKLVGEFIEETCVSPTFIMGHPQMMSPLAKYHRDRPGLCERFEAFVCRKEIVNAYTELNDPFDQRLRFEEQARQKAAGDDEAQLIDETFCESLEWALPPTGGFGMGIDRMAMFLTDNYSIREVLTFPYMKKQEQNEKKGTLLAAEEVGIEPAEVVEDVRSGQ
ncbi:MAG: hypothetical protein Q9162_003315 [Coniocarpon cinnabarinum]